MFLHRVISASKKTKTPRIFISTNEGTKNQTSILEHFHDQQLDLNSKQINELGCRKSKSSGMTTKHFFFGTNPGNSTCQLDGGTLFSPKECREQVYEPRESAAKGVKVLGVIKFSEKQKEERTSMEKY